MMSKDKPISLMIVDDSESFRILLSEMLSEETSLEIASMAKNGMDAVDKALFFKPDVILMDIQMPLMNGYDATKIIKNKIPNVWIIGLSNAVDPISESKMLECGATMLLPKGIPLEKIVESIHRCSSTF